MLWWLCRPLVFACLEIVDLSNPHLILWKTNILLHLFSQFIVVTLIFPLNTRGLIHPLYESSQDNRGHTDDSSCFHWFCFCHDHSKYRHKKRKKEKGWPHLMYLITYIMKTLSRGLLPPRVCNKPFLSQPLSNKQRQMLSPCPCSSLLPVLPPLLAGSRGPIWHIRTDKQKSVRRWALASDLW